MKVVQKGEVTMKVLDSEARVLVRVHGWKYRPNLAPKPGKCNA